MKTRRQKKTEPVNEETFTLVEIDDYETICRVCDAEFLDEVDLKLHVTQVHLNESNGKTICEVCCAVLSNAEAFVSHLIFKHLENFIFCFYCYRAFTDQMLLDQHELKHCSVAVDSDLTCSQCPSIYSNRQTLQSHEYSKHRNSDDGFMFNDFFSLLSSGLNIKIKNFLDCLCKKQPLTCRNCSLSCLDVKKYIEHLKISKCQSFACDKCYNVYKKKHSIVIHMQKKPQCHNYPHEKVITMLCPQCKKYFDVKAITEHMDTCKVIRCSACDKIFNSMYELTDHRKHEHQISISLEICKFCKKEFVGTLSLKKHMSRSHKNRGLYKYNCVYCSSMFNHPKRLFAHFFTQHKNIEPYTCKICDKRFRLRKHFTIHIKLHHKSIGFVEFDKNLHVIFTDKKSEKPIEPQAPLIMDSTTDVSDSDCNNDMSAGNDPVYISLEDTNSKEKEIFETINHNIDTTQSSMSFEKEDFDDMPLLKVRNNKSRLKIEIPPLHSKGKKKQKQRLFQQVRKRTKRVNSHSPLSSENSEEEPLSKIKKSLSRGESQNLPNLRKRMAIRDKRARLTCKICNKYCYTVQNYHHHLTLHEKTKLKRCIKCQQCFKSRKALESHIESTHSSSQLIETLKSVLEKRKKIQPAQKSVSKPSELLRSLIEKRKKAHKVMAQNSITNKFRQTIKKVNLADDCIATITPISDHGLSVKNFIENFKPEGDSLNICNSVTIKSVTATEYKEPLIKMRQFLPELTEDTGLKLKLPIKYKDSPDNYIKGKVNVKLVQQLITKPKAVNMVISERVPAIEDKIESQYCNMVADETDYSQYKNDGIPEVAHEVMLEDLEDIPRTRRLAQEIIIPTIPKKYGDVRIGHLLPQAPYYKIVKVKNLIESTKDAQTKAATESPEKDVKLPDGTRLISVKNPYSHLIPNEHLEEVLKANKSKYYTPKTNNIEKALAKALSQAKPPREKKEKRVGKQISKKKS